MGIATIYQHRKSTPRLTKSPSLVLTGVILTVIQSFKYVKLNKEMFGSVRMTITLLAEPSFCLKKAKGGSARRVDYHIFLGRS